MSEPGLRSRRALLTGAAAGAAAVAANAVITASPALAANEPPVLLGAANDAVAAGTTLASAVAGTASLGVSNSADAGLALEGSAPASGTGVSGIVGDPAELAGLSTGYTGVFGFAAPGDGVNTWGSGVWGFSDDFGVYGSGSTGVYGDGGTGGTGVEAFSDGGYGLYVTGKVKFANRSGKIKVAKGKASVTGSVPGMTSGNIVIAVLQTSETGTWVRAAVAASGKFTVYFNRALPSSSSVGWIVLG